MELQVALYVAKKQSTTLVAKGSRIDTVSSAQAKAFPPRFHIPQGDVVEDVRTAIAKLLALAGNEEGSAIGAKDGGG